MQGEVLFLDSNKFRKGRMFLVAVDEKEYPGKIVDLLRVITNTYNKICYLCFNKPYADVVEELKTIGLDMNKFFFIDYKGFILFYSQNRCAGFF